MSARFHLNPETGEVGRCSAQTNCPFSGATGTENHYDTSSAARKDYESRMKDQLIPSVSENSSTSLAPRDLAKKLTEGIPGSTLWLGGRPGADSMVTLDKIEIPKEHRGKGHASRIMKEIIDAADKEGWTVSLTPSNAFGASVVRLKKFYKTFGFVENKGRNKDFRTRDTMIRPPRER